MQCSTRRTSGRAKCTSFPVQVRCAHALTQMERILFAVTNRGVPNGGSESMVCVCVCAQWGAGGVPGCARGVPSSVLALGGSTPLGTLRASSAHVGRHTCTHTHTETHTHTHAHTRTHTRMHTRTHARAHAHTHTYTHH
jgi:hypothetical protein